jgi:two-component system sensor histidine kinase ChvG
MVQDTDSREDEGDGLMLRWSRSLSLTKRILLVNIVPLLMLAGSFFYLDAVRARLIAERISQAQSETKLMAFALSESPAAEHPRLVREFGQQTGTRLRLVTDKGQVLSDNWLMSLPNFALIDPRTEPWQRHFARRLDDIIDAIVGAERLREFSNFALPAVPSSGDTISLAGDRTHMISITRPVGATSGLLLVNDRNVRDIRRLVRAERTRLGYIIGVTTLVSVLLSLFLARTIARPLILLARAAVSVRMGRAREVHVPRLPSRQDEIGLVARALSDMNQALQARIDSIEAFAADVSHELKNPLASMSSAIESLATVKDAGLRQKLMGIVQDDVVRLDRLITDISELSRIDAQLARSRFERIDMGSLIEGLLKARAERGMPAATEIAFARPKKGTAIVRGDTGRLARVIENLLDNAISFSPEKGVVRISAARSGDQVIVSVEDEGPGVPEYLRKDIFNRFHSDRPEEEAFGKHSGLGLSIAQTVIEAHKGSIEVRDRPRKKGAWFFISLPASEAA